MTLADVELEVDHPLGVGRIGHQGTGSECPSAAIDDLLAGSFDELAHGQCSNDAEPARIEGVSVDLVGGGGERGLHGPRRDLRRAQVGQGVRIVVDDGVPERGHQAVRSPRPDRGHADRAGPEPGAITVEARAADEAAGGHDHAVERHGGGGRRREGRGPPRRGVDDQLGTVEVDGQEQLLVAGVDGQQGLVQQRRARAPAAPAPQPPTARHRLGDDPVGRPARGPHPEQQARVVFETGLGLDGHRVRVRLGEPPDREVLGAEARERREALPGRAASWPGQIEAALCGQVAQPGLDLPLSWLRRSGDQDASPSTFRESAKPPRTRLCARPLVVTTRDRGEATG